MMVDCFHGDARPIELMLATPEPCPAFEQLVLVGVARGEAGCGTQLTYLILSVAPGQDVYVGPDPEAIGHHALVIAMMLMRSGPGSLPAELAGDVLDWIQAQWQTLHRGFEELMEWDVRPEVVGQAMVASAG